MDGQNEASRRNRAYAVTHQALIEGAVRLISEKGVDALSIAGLSRALRINRTTVYYHFAGREDLLEAVSAWSSEQLAQGFSPAASQRERIDFIARFVLENPDLIKLWIDEFISPGDIRERYPKWDDLVAGISASLGGGDSPPVDAEVYCTLLLTGAFIGPRVFRSSVRPDLDEEAIVERFRVEHQRILARDALLRG
jgi:AcrR family transcriptional regulator